MDKNLEKILDKSYPDFFRPLSEYEYNNLTAQQRIAYLRKAIHALPDDDLKTAILKSLPEKD